MTRPNGDLIVQSVTVAEVMQPDGTHLLMVTHVGDPEVWDVIGLLTAALESVRIDLAAQIRIQRRDEPMLTQALAWLATLLGLTSTWLVGKHHRCGWTVGIACCLLWAAVNLEIRLWPGTASSLIALVLSARNRWRWRQT